MEIIFSAIVVFVVVIVVTRRRKIRTLIIISLSVGSFFFADSYLAYTDYDRTLGSAFYLISNFLFFLILDAVAVDAIFSRIIDVFLPNGSRNAFLTDFLFWFVAGGCLPLAIIQDAIFGQLPGSAVLLGLCISIILAGAVFYRLHLRRIAALHPPMAALPGYAISMAVCIIVGLGLGVHVSHSAAKTAGDKPFCLSDGDGQLTSIFDTSPFTLVSPRDGGYHAVLIVDDKQFYNWSWYQLRFTPADMDYIFLKNCRKR